MTVEEARQHALDEKAREVFGAGDGATLMEMLADMATKDDLAGFEARLDRRFDTIDQRFEAIDRRFDTIDQRFEAIDRRFDTIDQRFEAIDRRFDAVDHRSEVLDHQWQARFEHELRQFTMRLTAMIATFVMGGMGLAAAIARISV